jgi:trigger factor
MDVQVEKLSPVLVEFQIQVPAETVNTEVEKSYLTLRRTARVRGYRRGKAPRKVLVHLYGPAVHAEVAKRLVETSLDKAIADNAVQPLTRPSVEPADLKPKEPFSFKARFEVRPEIEKVEWEGLEAKRPSTEISGEAIDADLERLRLEHATLQPLEGREAAAGDVASLSLSYEIDGETDSQELDTEVGSGQILKEIDEALVGMKPGETKAIATKMPAQHPRPELRDREVTFECTLAELKERVLPDLDDEFAKDCEHDDLAALKKSVEDRLGAKRQQESQEEVARQLVAQLCEKNVVPLPPSLVEQQSKMSEREMRMMAQMTGQPLDQNALGPRLRADSEQKVRAGLLMAEIAKEKALQVTGDDIEKGYAELAEQSGKNVAKIKAEYREKEKRDMLVGMILEDKVLDLLEKAAKISES